MTPFATRYLLSKKLRSEAKPFQIFIIPVGVVDNRPESADREGIVQRMIGDNDPASIGMFENAVAAAHALENEAIGFECVDQIARQESARRAGHTFTTTAGSGNSIVP